MVTFIRVDFERHDENTGRSHITRRCHYLRIDVTSSSSLRIDRNMNTGNRFGEDAEGIPAVQTIFHKVDCASYIDLPVIPGKSL